MTYEFARTSQAALETPMAGQAGVRASQAAILTVNAPPATRRAQASQAVVGTPFQGTTTTVIPRVSQAAVEVVFRTGAPDDLRINAWEFTLDGHKFYVLSLGEQGTWVYDLTTQQWSQWQTDGFEGIWNMQLGLIWDNKIIAGDLQNPLLWELDPETFTDEGFRPITRRATGLVTYRDKDYRRNWEFRITANLGEPTPDTPGTLEFSFSDDDGKTFSTPKVITLVADDFDQDLEFRSLGSIRKPGRVYQVTDVGGFVRLSGADADIEGLE